MVLSGMPKDTVMMPSVDSVSLVHRFSQRPSPEELIERGFRSKAGNVENSIVWYHNGGTGSYSPQLSWYEMYKGGYGLRADLSLPKYAHGNNVELLTTDEIFDLFDPISNEITHRAGMAFDAVNASTARIDYATNHEILREYVEVFFVRYHRFTMPRLKFREDLSHATSAYHGNGSRMFRSYDKTFEDRGPDESSDNIFVTDWAIIRLEYMLAKEAAVRAFAKRLGLPDTTAGTMLSAESRTRAMDEMLRLLQLDTFVPDADFSFEYFMERTQNISKSRMLSSFVEAHESLGRGFNRLPTAQMSDATYMRQLRECQKYGF